MAQKNPLVIEVAKDTYLINLFGLQSPTLLVGNERALLIDTGCGNYDLAGLVKEITDLPLTVAISHAHGDHIGGMHQFAEMYVHPRDIPAMEAGDFWPMYKGMMKDSGAFEAYDMPLEQLPKAVAQPRFLPMEDGQVFDLGGRTVMVYAVPGHTAGECVFMDNQSRILFSCDANNTNLGVTIDKAEALAALKRLKGLSGEWDRNFTGHVGWGGQSMLRCEREEVLDTNIRILSEILDGTLVPEVQKTSLGDRISVKKYGQTMWFR